MLLDVQPDRACYRPGETVQLLVSLTGWGTAEAGTEVQIVASIAFLADEVTRLSSLVQLAGGPPATAKLAWTPPPAVPRGYGVDLHAVAPSTDLDGSGQVLAKASTAFDVLEHWTQAPRYGFLTDFWPERGGFEQTMRWLARYHVNGLQFYDWMYRHDHLLPPGDVYDDPLGRRLSLATVRKLIDAAHARGVAAMPYTAVYGASPPFFQQHPDWALYDAEGEAIPFAEGFLMIMDPSPGSGWTEHLLGQFDEVLDSTEFDGIHLDQYGEPKVAHDAGGKRVDLAQALPQLIDLTKDRASQARPDSAVVFNCVGNWPIETVARSEQDFVYIEVWPPHTGYSDLHGLIVDAQARSGGKPVVLAAYVDPARARNARLADAVILASGGSHIELGEPGMMLADPYFPAYQPMGDELARVMQRTYDFAVRYENVLALDSHDATPAYQDKLQIEGTRTGDGRSGSQIWPIVRQRGGRIGLSLINLMGLDSLRWDRPLEADPAPQRDLRLRLTTPGPVRRVWWATPDGDSPAGHDLAFSLGREGARSFVTLRLPWLAYWDLIVVELEDE